MTLTREQFQGLRDKGLSTKQIVSFESGAKPGAVAEQQEAPDVPVGQLTPQQLESEGIRFAKPGEIEQLGQPQILQPNFREVVSPLIKGANAYALGIPEAVTRARDIESSNVLFADQETGQGKVLSGAAQATGLFKGVAAKVSTGAVGLIPKTMKGSNVIKGLIGGGLFGALQLDKDPTFKKQLNQAKKGAALGGLFGLATGAISRFSNKEGAVAKEITKLRDRFFKVKKDAVDTFGNTLDDLVAQQPNNTIDLRDEALELINNFDDLEPATKAVLRKVPRLNNVIKNSDKIDDLANVTVKDAQEIANQINASKSKTGEVIDLVSDIKARQLDAFPEMSKVREEYAKIAGPFNNIKNQLKFNRLEKAVAGNFGGIEGRKAVEELLGPKTIKKLGGLKKAIIKIQDSSKDIGLIKKSKAFVGATAREGIRFIIYKKFIFDSLGI